MMKTSNLLLCGLICCAFWPSHAQQLPYMNLIYESNFVHNPAMAAHSRDLDAGAFYHRQWSGFDGAPVTASAFAAMPFAGQNMSAGLALNYDLTGPIQHSSADLAYAYRLRFGRHFTDGALSIGIGLKLGQYRFDGGQLVATDTGDPLLLENLSSGLLPNASAGLYYTSISEHYRNRPFFFAGLAINQLMPVKWHLEEEVPAGVLPRAQHFNALIGYRFFTRDGRLFVQPALRANYAAHAPLLLMPEVLLEWVDVFWAGLAYSGDNTVLLQLGMSFPWEDQVLKVGTLTALNVGQLRTHKTIGYGFYIGYNRLL